MPAMATSNRFLFAVVVVVPYLVVSLFLLLSSSVVNVVVDAAHPRRRVTARREGASYDREITTFTEDGRLAQVEYGLEASLRGSTVVAIQVRLQPPPTTTEQEGNDNANANGKATTVAESSASSSCIVVCIENSSFGKMHRIDDHIWMLTAGLAGDARMLANQARRACQNHRLQYGEAPTTQQAARITADFYHQLTRMGGCRPLGCTSILMGVDIDDATNNNAKLFRTDPGGGVEECLFCAAGNSQETMGKELMALVASFDGDGDNGNGHNTGEPDEKKESKSPGNHQRNWRSRRIARIATTLADKVVRLLDRNGKTRKGKNSQQGTTLDVWTIQPMKHRRGGMLATCYSDVRKDNVNEILLQHL
jgi:20S proteasome alpha/beta subunit